MPNRLRFGTNDTQPPNAKAVKAKRLEKGANDKRPFRQTVGGERAVRRARAVRTFGNFKGKKKVGVEKLGKILKTIDFCKKK